MKREETSGAQEAICSTTLEREAVAQFEEKKSVFIGHAKPVESEEEAQEFLRKVRAEHSDARHNVWAYRLRGDVILRCSDDGEPQGSAGVPVLDTIRKSGVSNAMVVVTRYFGGILLGAGGLVRAYSHAAKLAIDEAHVVTYEQYTEFTLECSYSVYQRYLAELPKFGALTDDTLFSDRVTLLFAVRSVLADAVREKIREMSGGCDTPQVRGTRFDCESG